MRGERRGGLHTADLTFIVVLPRNLIISEQIIIKHLWFGANTQRTQLIRVQYSPYCTLPDCQKEIKSPLVDLGPDSFEILWILNTIATDDNTFLP